MWCVVVESCDQVSWNFGNVAISKFSDCVKMAPNFY